MPRRSLLWPDPRVKPPFGAAEIDWGQAPAGLMAYWLFNELGGGVVSDLVDSRAGGTITLGAGSWTTSAGGAGLTTDASATKITCGTNTDFNILAAPGYSIGIRAIFFSLANFQDMAARDNAASTAGYRCQLLNSASSNRMFTRHMTPGNSDLNSTNTNNIVQVGVETDLLWTWDGTTAEHFINGKSYAAGAVAAPATGGGNPLTIGAVIAGTTARAQVTFLRALFVGRALSASEAFQAFAEPYAMLRPLVRRRYFVPASAAGGIPTLVGRRFSLAGPRGLAG